MYNPYYPTQSNVYPQQMNVAPTQNSSMMIATEEEVMKYPIAPGNTIPFKISGQPLIIEKSMGLSQFDSPKYKRFRVIEEGSEEDVPQIEYIPKEIYDNDIKEIRSDIEYLKKSINRSRVKKENTNDQYPKSHE